MKSLNKLDPDLVDKLSPIKHAAIKINNIVYVGHRHHDCFRVIHECGVNHKITDKISGFVDENGQFWNRKEALEIANHFGQVKKKHHPLYELLSEDIY